MAELEAWRKIPEFPNYEASNKGRIKSLDHVTIYMRGDRPARMTKKGKVLTPTVSQRGASGRGLHLRVSITGADGKQRLRSVHSLVMAAWRGPRPPGSVIRHLDDDYRNNNLRNLRYGTHRENTMDAVRNGKHPETKVTHCPAGHEYAGDNLFYDKSGAGSVTRKCRKCVKAHRKERYLRDKERKARAS